MPTVKQLREQANSYGLKGFSTLRKPGLIRLIAEARVSALRERLKRARDTGRYPALLGDPLDPYKRAQRRRELRQLDDEVTATLRARKYEATIRKNPWQQLEPLKKATKRILRHGFRKEPLARSIIRKGEKTY